MRQVSRRMPRLHVAFGHEEIQMAAIWPGFAEVTWQHLGWYGRAAAVGRGGGLGSVRRFEFPRAARIGDMTIYSGRNSGTWTPLGSGYLPGRG
eukprot:5176025-Prymnesium_polylepis.1